LCTLIKGDVIKHIVCRSSKITKTRRLSRDYSARVQRGVRGPDAAECIVAKLLFTLQGLKKTESYRDLDGINLAIIVLINIPKGEYGISTSPY
jgi:hypothetical protein